MNEHNVIYPYTVDLNNTRSIRVLLTVGPPYHCSSASADSTHHGLCSTIVFTLDKYLHMSGPTQFKVPVMEYYSAIKRNEILRHSTTWINLEN